MKIILDDSRCRDDLYPLTATRSAADLRVGILTIKEKWEFYFGDKVLVSSPFGRKNSQKEGSWLIPANLVPGAWIKKWHPGKNDKKILKQGWVIRFPFDITRSNGRAIAEDFELLTAGRRSQKISSTNKITGNVFLEKGAMMEHAIINATHGPVYIGKNARVMEGCLVQGPFAMCEGSVLKMGSKVYGATTLGPYCIAGGEIKNSVMLGYSNKSHDGYLGDSVIGEWCNLGAGSSCSNIKNTAGEIHIRNRPSAPLISAGLKCGLIMGDYSRSAINTSFNTGTVVGVACNVFSDGFPPTFIEDFRWGIQRYDLEKALQHIANWKKLKGKRLTKNEVRVLENIYNKKN